jgi:hypothetical protein
MDPQALSAIRSTAKQHPNAKLRIVCISDGVNNKSRNTASGLSPRLSLDGLVVDSFCLGEAKDSDLQTLSRSHVTNVCEMGTFAMT